MSQALTAALQNLTLHPHPVEHFKVIKMHASWVLLAGPYAYRIKRPMDFGFLDFTSLDKRCFYCNEGLHLNQCLANGLYLEALSITDSGEALRISDDGEVIEYLLKMRQFPQDSLLAVIRGHGELSSQHIDELAKQVAHFHQNTLKVPLEHPLGVAESCMVPMRQNFKQIHPLPKDKTGLQQLDALKAWAESSFERLLPVLRKHKVKGFIHECHGDTHLGNVALTDGRIVLFGCIEFNEPFRFTDVYADFAFFVVDLGDRGLKCHARRFVDLYLEHTGGYQALELLNFYKAYRAMVRAKVALFSLGYQTDVVQRATTLCQHRDYTNLTESYSTIPPRSLAITHGVSAVGKSQIAIRLVETLGTVRLCSDVERKRLFGEQPEHDRGQFAAGVYSSQASEATYAHLHQLATETLQAGYPMVVDAAYLKRNQHQTACHIAGEVGVSFLIPDCQTPGAVIAGWLARRQAESRDPFDATLDMIRTQQATREPLTTAGTAQGKRVDAHNAASLDGLVNSVCQHLPGL